MLPRLLYSLLSECSAPVSVSLPLTEAWVLLGGMWLREEAFGPLGMLSAPPPVQPLPPHVSPPTPASATPTAR